MKWGVKMNNIINNLPIFKDKSLSEKQKDITLRFVFGESVDSIAQSYNSTARSIFQHLKIVRDAFNDISLSELRAVVFMRIINCLFLK